MQEAMCIGPLENGFNLVATLPTIWTLPSITSVGTPIDIHAEEVAKGMLAALRDGEPFPMLRLATHLRVRSSTGLALGQR